MPTHFWKQFVLTIMICLILSGCGSSRRKHVSYPRPSIPPAPSSPSDNKVGQRSPQSLDNVRTASLPPKGGNHVPLPEPHTGQPGDIASASVKPLLAPGASSPLEQQPQPAPASLPEGPSKAKKRILVVGDSLSVGIGAALTNLFKNNDHIWVLEEGKVSSGLNSPDFYDWYQKLTQLVNEQHPDVVVIIIGGNDAYNGSGSAAWAKTYRQKVQKFLDIANQKGIQVYWAGLPVMRKPGFSEKVKTANSVIQSVCDSSDHCRYIDTWDLVDGSDHGYVHAMNLKGKNVVIRAGDGTHFTFTGYKMLGQHIIDHMTDL